MVLCGKGAYGWKGTGGGNQSFPLRRKTRIVVSPAGDEHNAVRRRPVPEELSARQVAVGADRAADVRGHGALSQAPTGLPRTRGSGSSQILHRAHSLNN